MSYLLKHFIVRFADNRPPLGESRLLGFAKDPTAPLNPEEVPEGMKPEEADVFKLSKESLAGMQEIVPEILIPGFEEACESEEWLKELFERPGAAKEKIEELLKAKGHDVSALYKLDPTAFAPGERRALMGEVLQAHPNVLLHIAESVERRIQRHEEARTSIERKIHTALWKKIDLSKESFKISTETVEKMEELAKALENIPNQRIAEVIDLLQTNKEGELSEQEIVSKLLLTQAGTPEHAAVITFIIDLKTTLHRQRKFGSSGLSGKTFESDDAYNYEQYSYRSRLEKEKAALRSYIDNQLEKRTKHAMEQNFAARTELQAKIAKPGEILTPTERDERTYQAEGYDYAAFLDATTNHVQPLRDLGLYEDEKEKRTKHPRKFNARIPKHAPNFLEYAQEAFSVLLQREKGGDMELSQLLKDKKRDQKELEEWACKTAKQLERMRQWKKDDPRRVKVSAFLYAGKKTWAEIIGLHDFFRPYAYLHDDPTECARLLNANLTKRLYATDPEFDWNSRHDTELIGKNEIPRSRTRSLNKRQLLTAILTLAEQKPDALLEGQQDLTKLEQEQAEFKDKNDASVSALILETRANLGSVLGSIGTSEHLQHGVCEEFRIDELLDYKKNSIEGLMGYNDKYGNPVITEDLRDTVPIAVREVRELKKTSERLEGINKNIKYQEMDDDAKGFFDRGAIYINSNRPKDVQTQALYHETGHAVLWALQASFPLLLVKTYDTLKNKTSQQSGKSFEDILVSLQNFNSYKDITDQMDTFREEAAKKWTGAQDIEEETRRLHRSELLDELLVRHAEWKKKGQPAPDPNSPEEQSEHELFAMLKEEGGTFSDELLQELANVGEPMSIRKYSRDDDMDLGAEGAGGGGEATSEKTNVHQSLRDIRRNIEIMESFRKAYAEYPELKQTIESHIQNAKSRYQELMEKFLKLNGGGQVPEEDPAFVLQVTELKNYTSKVKEKIGKIDVEQLDVSQIGKDTPPGFFDNIQFLSILDIVKMWKDTQEDILSIYKRSQDGRLKSVQANITDALGIGKDIPIFGKYFEALRGYHERRYSGTDSEAAKKWQDSMTLIDSHEVLHMIAHTRNRDLVRGGIGLLVERGEMDWNDEGVWSTLETMSGYRMPHKACLRDDLLRDAWLRRMVNEIWHDKEQYYHWKQGNDSHFESHKKEFTPTCDNLSNVSGGLANELRKQLKLFVEWGHKGPVPDDIKPHLYEECLHYAMRNGKMSMEQKIFYLVQGVRHGLLGIDRLRVLAGEGGEILLRFPFIDYFYGKNNTMPEIRRLGERLEEGKGDKAFAPGAKTMLFLQFELAREESFKHRLSKALARDNMEKIDHEDYPMIVGQVDFSVTDNMTGMLSGTRTKITKESAKNSYMGFNTKFKAFARLAEMEGKGLARFTSNDARDIAKSVAAFLHFDNILTLNASDGTDRLRLTWDDINNTTAPSSNGMKVKEFRDRALSFINKLMDKLEQQGFNWGAVGTTRQEYLQQLNDDAIRPTSKQANDAQKNVHGATQSFQRELERVVGAASGAQTLKQVLMTQADRRNADYIMEEGASADPDGEYLSSDITEKYFKGLAQEERAEKVGHGHATPH